MTRPARLDRRRQRGLGRAVGLERRRAGPRRPGLVEFRHERLPRPGGRPAGHRRGARGGRAVRLGCRGVAAGLGLDRAPTHALADALAEFEQVEAVALFPTGFAANLGTIAALVGPGRRRLRSTGSNHACLIDGARLSGARLRVYPHGDADRLDAILDARRAGRFRRAPDRHRRRLQHGRRPRAAGRPGRPGRAVRGHAAGGRGPRHGRLRSRRPGSGGGAGGCRSGSRCGSARSQRPWARSAGSSPARDG